MQPSGCVRTKTDREKKKKGNEHFYRHYFVILFGDAKPYLYFFNVLHVFEYYLKTSEMKIIFIIIIIILMTW